MFHHSSDVYTVTTGRTVFHQQIEEFCGNAIEAQNADNELFLIMSSRAFKALNQEQINKLLTSYKEIIHSDIPTIEKYGGGSARCMLTELF